MSARKAHRGDYPALIGFGRKFFCSLPYRDVEYCEASARRWLDLMSELGVLLVAELDGAPVGMAGGIYSPFVFNDRHKVGAEVMWWVEPEHRGSGVGGELLDLLEQCAAEAGCIRWSMMAIEDGSIDRVAAMYQRAGYRPAERTFVKVPTWPQ